MQVRYIGPLCRGMKHPALEGYDLSKFAPTCFLVEVSEEAGVDGTLIEGDLLVVDEGKVVQHADLVIVEREGQHQVYSSHRIGGGFRAIPFFGREGFSIKQSEVRGVVVSQARRYSF